MTLNLIEKTLVKTFFKDKGISIVDVDCFFSGVSIRSREFTGSGFITDLARSERLKVESDDSSYKWGKLGAKLNGTIDTGYLIYVDCGYLHALEGYTYAEEWPEDISEIETYIV